MMADQIKGILFVDTTPYFGDEQRNLAALLRHLDKSRFQPYLLTADNSDSGLQHLFDKHKTVQITPLKLKVWRADTDDLISIFWDLYFFHATVKKFISNYDIAIVYANTYYAGLLSTFTLPRSVKLVYSLTDYHCRTSAVCQIVKRSSKTLVLSKYLNDFWNKKLKYSFSEKMHPVYPGADFEYDDKLRRDFVFRENYTFDPDTRFVTFFADMYSWKRHELFLRSFTKALDSEPNLFAMVVGKVFDDESNEYLKELICLARKLDIIGNVAFLEFVDEYHTSIVEASDIIVSLTENEPYTVNYVQALTCGVPVLMLNGTENDDVLDECEAIHKVSADPDELAKGMLHCMSFVGVRKEILGKARKFAKQYSIGSYMDRVHESLDDCLD